MSNEITDRLKDGVNEPVIRVTDGLLALSIIAALVSAVGLADPLIAFLNADFVYGDLGDFGTVSNGLVIGLVSLLGSFVRNEAEYSEFTTIQRVFYGLGTLGFLSVFLSDTVNTAVSGDPLIGGAVVGTGIVYHYSVSAADVLGARFN
jgi:hypothetical protein